MTTKRRRHTAAFKAKVALEATKEIRTLNELSAQYGIHPAQISQWKNQLLEGISTLFGTKNASKDASRQIDELYRQIGEVTVERDWLKKKSETLR